MTVETVDRRDRDRRGNGRRDDFKKEVVAMIVLIKTDVTVRIIKPRNTSSEKQTGFVIRNKEIIRKSGSK